MRTTNILLDLKPTFNNCIPNFGPPCILNSLRQSKNHFLTLAMITIPDFDTQTCGDISTDTFRPLVPARFKKQVFDLVHDFSHPGIKATQKLTSKRFV